MIKEVLLLAVGVSVSLALTGEEILKKMDYNRDYTTIQYKGTMEIIMGSQTRVKTMTASALGGTKRQAITEYTNASDKGTKYLMLEENLWIYFPKEDDVVKISGHMLKEGMMGSDVSYEDALEADNLSKKYTITIVGDTVYDGKACLKLQLIAKVKDVSYYKRMMIVDTTKFVCWREQMYAPSGKLLKESKVLAITKIGNRYYPTKIEMSNKLRKNSRTIFAMADIVFDKPLSPNLFSMKYLGR